MKKLLALMGVLLLMAFSFAGRAPMEPTQWKNYMETCCYYNMMSAPLNGEGGLYSYAGYFYYVWDGQECIRPTLDPDPDELFEAMWGRGGVSDLYFQTSEACYGGVTEECKAYRKQFASTAASAMQLFKEARREYGRVEKQSLADHRTYGDGCSLTRSFAKELYLSSMSEYKECRAACRDGWSEECAYYCDILR